MPPAEAAAIDARLTPEVMAVCELDRAIAAKQSAGGTAPARVAEQLAGLDAAIAAARTTARAVPRLAELWTQLAQETP